MFKDTSQSLWRSSMEYRIIIIIHEHTEVTRKKYEKFESQRYLSTCLKRKDLQGEES